jgi:hypothetical protein
VIRALIGGARRYARVLAALLREFDEPPEHDHPASCSECYGSGVVNDRMSTCPVCGGAGKVDTPRRGA